MTISYEIFDPPFWGLGEMLQWEWREFFQHLPADARTQAIAASEMQESTFLTAAEKSFNLRGYYGFYPVYTYGLELSIQQPGALETQLSQWNFEEADPFLEFFRPEGDLLCLCSASVIDITAKSSLISNAQVCNLLSQHLIARLAREISRSLMIEEKTARCFDLSEVVKDPRQRTNTLIQLAGIEQRLDADVDKSKGSAPPGVSTGVFFPQAPQGKLKRTAE